MSNWPALPYEGWKDTYATLHMWSQVVGKVALAQAPPLNHSWGAAFHVTARGLQTRRLVYADRSFTVEFDFIDHQLVIEASDGDRRSLPLESRTVASFYRDTMATLAAMALPVKIWTTLRQDLTPVIAAASTLLIAFTILLMIVAALLRKGRKA